MIKSENEIKKILQKRPRFSDMANLLLPNSLYRSAVKYSNSGRKKAMHEEMPGYFSMQYLRLLAACFNDRKYIDYTCKSEFIDSIKNISRRIQTCGDIGITLCDLGYKNEGIEYLEKTVKLVLDNYDNPIVGNWKVVFIWILCARLNTEADYDKKLRYIEEFESKINKDDPDENIDIFRIIRIKGYIDKKKFNEAKKLLDKFTKKDFKWCGFQLAEFYFATGDFKASAETFEKYPFTGLLYFQQAQYDYIKAQAFYHSSQIEKCRKQAVKIKRRKKWRRFYNLENLEDLGIKRDSFIDEIINSYSQDGFYIDTEKTIHHVKASIYIICCYFLNTLKNIKTNCPYLFFLSALLIYILDKLKN